MRYEKIPLISTSVTWTSFPSSLENAGKPLCRKGLHMLKKQLENLFGLNSNLKKSKLRQDTIFALLVLIESL